MVTALFLLNILLLSIFLSIYLSIYLSDTLSVISFYCYLGCEIEPPVTDGIPIPPKLNTVGSLMKYKCAPKHEPTGTPEVQCMPNGEWSFPNFNCIICKYKGSRLTNA